MGDPLANRPGGDFGADEFSQLEKTIFEARHYVVPTDDLRPRTLEAAREDSQQKRGFQRLSVYAVACLLIWLVCLPVGRAVSVFRSHMVAPSTEDLQRVALELSAEKSYGPDWGMVEVFERLRGLHVDTPKVRPLNARDR